MTGIKEAFGDIADEITPSYPPVEAAMMQGRRRRNGRLAAVIGGTVGTVVIGTGLALGIPALVGQRGEPANGAGTAAPSSGPLIRPVLLTSPHGSAAEYGDASLVNAAVLRLFDRLGCAPGPNAVTVGDGWKTALGYTAGQWNAPGSEAVACDAKGDKYVLGPAVVLGPQVMSSVPIFIQVSRQWVVNLNLDPAATRAVAALTKEQYNDYFQGYQRGNKNDAALGESAVLLNGNVLATALTMTPVTPAQEFIVQGPQPGGFTLAQAETVARQLKVPAIS
jgi:hypothetical protein